MTTTQDIHTVEEGRFAVIEQKLDHISERLEALIRLEERHDGAVRRIDRLEERMDTHGGRVAKLETTAALNTKSASHVERVGWIGLAAATNVVTYFLTYFLR